jgi:hypothetical protein
VWALFDEGKTIAYYSNEGDWISYDADAGWSAAPPDIYDGQVAIDHNGGVWIALGRNGLRFLNPYTNQWSLLRAGHIGFDRPPESDAVNEMNYDENLAFLDVATDATGHVWVSACTVRLFHEDSPQPVQLGDGQGVRYFDGRQWFGPSETADRCVYNLEIDELGQIWLAGPENDLWTGANNFLHYDPAADTWTPIAVPESLDMFKENPRFARSIWFDDQNRPWLIVARRGGATFPPDAVYYQDQGSWTTFLELLPGRLVPGSENQMWLLLFEPVPYQDRLLSGLILLDDGRPQEVNLPVDLIDPWTLTVDGTGRAWLIGRDETSLWYFDPTE